jgi:hypothetical protein
MLFKWTFVDSSYAIKKIYTFFYTRNKSTVIFSTYEPLSEKNGCSFIITLLSFLHIADITVVVLASYLPQEKRRMITFDAHGLWQRSWLTIMTVKFQF